MAPHSSLFSEFDSIPQFEMIMGDESEAEVLGPGNVELELNINGTARRCFLQIVLHVPGLL